MERVFISYSRNNLDVVQDLIQDLKAVGIDAWHDKTLTGGQRWWDRILSNIRDCEVFILALSPESLDSEACKSELSYVAQLSRTILPVLVADGVNLNLLSPPLSEIQVTDYRQRDKEAAFALVKAINTAPKAAPLPDPLPAPPPVPVSYLSSLKEQIDSDETLDSQSQIALLFELEAELKKGRSPTEVRDLLLRLRQRDDLLAKVGNKVDAALRSLENDASIPRDVGPGSTALRSATQDKGSAVGTRPGSRPVQQPGPAAIAEESGVCPQCGTQIDQGSKFCSACGTSLPQQSGSEAGSSKSRRYACASGGGPRIISEVKTWLDGQGFDSQQLSTEKEGVLLQIKKRGGWRDFVGMSTSLNIVFHQLDDTLTVEIGAGKWLDKAAVGTVSMFILWPLALTAGFGAWQQMKMPDKIFDYVGSRLTYK